MRFSSLTAAIALAAGCAADVPVPDLCDMPSGARGWNGAQVSWSGIVIGEYHHGYVLACPTGHRGIAFSTDENTIGLDALGRALDGALSPSEHGVLRMSVEGRLGRSYGPPSWRERPDAPILRITAVRRIWFERMSPAQVRAIRDR